MLHHQTPLNKRQTSLTAGFVGYTKSDLSESNHMKRFSNLLVILSIVLLSSPISADSYREWQPYKDYLRLPDKYKSPAMEKMYRDSYEAMKRVKNLPCKKGGTVDTYLNKKAAIPAIKDLGWNVFPSSDGGFDVERLMILNNKLKLKYRWQVDKYGTVKATNGKAIGITH